MSVVNDGNDETGDAAIANGGAGRGGANGRGGWHHRGGRGGGGRVQVARRCGGSGTMGGG